MEEELTTFRKIYGDALGNYICNGNLNVFGLPLPGKGAKQVKFKLTPRKGQSSLGEVTIIYEDGTERIFPIDNEMQASLDEALLDYLGRGKEIKLRDKIDDNKEFGGVPIHFRVRYEPERMKDKEIRIEIKFKGGRRISVPMENEFKLIR